MTNKSELTHKFEVYIEGVPAPVVSKIVSEAFNLYYRKHADDMSEEEHDEMMEVFHAFIGPLLNIDYSTKVHDFIDLPEDQN
jgi:hypothetical protein